MENMVDSDYRGMDTGRLVQWRHRRREDPQWDMHHGTDHSHSHRPGEIKQMSVTKVFFAMFPILHFVLNSPSFLTQFDVH